MGLGKGPANPGATQVLPLQARQHSLLILDGVVAGITHSDLELEAHDGVAGAFAAAFATHGLPTLPAVVLGTGERGKAFRHRVFLQSRARRVGETQDQPQSTYRWFPLQTSFPNKLA